MSIVDAFTDDDEPSNPLDGYWMEGDSLAPPCQAEMDVVDSILSLAELNSESVLFDLGCGDGRICIQASATYHCKSLGCEIEPRLVEKFRAMVSRRGLVDLVTVVHDDLLRLDLSSASVIVLYLLPEAIKLMTPSLEKFLRERDDSVIVCNTWGPRDWTPEVKISCGFCNNVTLLKYNKSSLPSVSNVA